MAVGAYAWHRGPDRRFGLVLIAAAAGWAVTTLAETDDSLATPSAGPPVGWSSSWSRSAAMSTSPPHPAPARLYTAACRRAERHRRLRCRPCASQTARSARVERSCLRR